MKFITRILPLALLLTGLSFSFGLSQKAAPKVTVTRVIDASADEVWTVLRKLDNIDELSSTVAKVSWKGPHDVGGQRTCKATEGDGQFVEKILSFDDINRSYTYALLEGVPATNMVNMFKVVDLGYQRSLIIWTSSYEGFMQNPEMTEEQFLGFLNQSIEEMITNTSKSAKS